ncbi:MAG TPA: serine/threonine-protein kinase [Nostocaceae cyanobacterium]|nr:serine/threonine-protein kinase [Nostocaceae cyanobacterium]
MLGQLLDGRYKIIRVLGAGGFGQTFIAEDTKLYNSQCVVKQLKPMSTDTNTLQVARRLFEAEAQLLHKLGTHDQIPQLLAHFEENQEFFLVQQFIDGHPLSDELRPGTKFNEVEVISLLENILQPLTFVHQNQVIHRDIKPPNLIRRHSDNKVVLIDFGAVKQISTQVTNGEGVTKMTVGIGTAGYMPSEQSRGSPRLSSDVYAVGMIGIQALTGLMPHQLQEDIETAEIVWRNLVPVSTALADILDRMVRYDFRQRYQSAAEALAAIQQLNNAAYAPTQVSAPEYIATLPSTNTGDTPRPQPVNSEPPLYSPPPTVPPQYRQEVPQAVVSSSPPTPVSTNRPQIGAGFYFQWILANIGGLITALIVAVIVQMSLHTGTPNLFRRVLMMGGAGATIGGMQSLVLRQQIPLSEKWWIAGTTIGFCISVFLSGTNPYNALFWVGPIVGIIQWFMLRRFVKQSGWWVLVNAIFGGLGGIMSGAVLILLLGNQKSIESKNP